MNTNVLSQSVETQVAPSFSRRITRTMLRLRAIEVAIRNGRAAHQVVKSDWDQANRELNDQAQSNSSDSESRARIESLSSAAVSAGQNAPVND